MPVIGMEGLEGCSQWNFRPHSRRFLSALRLQGSNCRRSVYRCRESLVEQLAASASEKSPQRGFNTIVENYLSAAHRDEPADGCPIAALGSEIARSDERTRAAATQALLKFVDVIASQSGKTRPDVVSAAHRDEPADGCPIAALGSEIARSDERTRAAATQALLKFVDVIASQSGKTRPDVAQRGALVAAALMIGALTMSRVVTDPEAIGRNTSGGRESIG